MQCKFNEMQKRTQELEDMYNKALYNEVQCFANIGGEI